MPVEDKSEEIDSPKKTRGGKSVVKAENISPTDQTGTPARRVTRRTSQLDDNDDEVVASPAIVTRRSARTRKNTAEDTVDTPGRRTTRRTSVEPAAPAQVGTPQRRTRSSSIQSEDGNSAVSQAVQKQPTIQEKDLPVGRRTRASSVTSDDGSVANSGTPKKRGRKSLAASVKIIEPVIEETEDHHSPARPTTRSMSNSPANVSEKMSSPLKVKSPLVTKTPEVVEEDNADETIKTIAKDISQKLSNDKLESPDIFLSPGTSKTKKDNSLLSSAKKNANIPDRSVIEPMTPNGKTPKSSKNTPTSAIKHQTPASNKKSPGTPVSSKNATVAFIPTPFPTKGKIENKNVFSKSWSQPVFGSATSKIDHSGSKKVQRVSMGGINVQTMQISSSSDDSDDDDPKTSVFLDEAVEVAKGYESGDSMDDDEKEVADEDRMHEELGEEIGSEDSESPDEEEDYDKDSFIASEEEQELLSYSDDDEHLNDSKSLRAKKTARKSAPGRMVLDSSEESDNEVNISKKAQSEKKVQKRPSTEATDESPQATNSSLFDNKPASKLDENDDESVADTEVDEEPMDVDETFSLNGSLTQNRSLKVFESSGSEIELPKATADQIAAAKNSLINAARKIRHNIAPAKPIIPTIVKKVESELAETEDCSTDDEKAAKIAAIQSNTNSFSHDSSDESMDDGPANETESAKRKRRRTGSLDNSIAQPIKKTKLNVSLVSEAKLDTILEKCNEILKCKKEEKKKNKLIHKKEKEEKKKRKELAKQKQEGDESDQDGSGDGQDESLRKKKKKQKIGRKYNKDIKESTSTKEEEISQAVKRSQEILEKKRERKRLKKQAKLEKAKEEVIDVTKKPKNDKENLSNSKHENQEEKPKKPKTLLTAFEVKQQLLLQESTVVENGVKEKRDKNKLKKDEVVPKTVPDKENTNSTDDTKQKKKKKTKKVLEPVQESNHNDGPPPSPPAKKRMLNILNPKGSLNKQGFVVDPVTPDIERLKRNRGFVEEPLTPKPIGFKVQTMMPSGEEFVKKANKKRKRAERDIPEPSRLPPKPVWTASGAFEEIDANDSSDFIPLTTKSRTATQFGVSVLNKKQAKENTNGATNGLSSFKMKALYNDKGRMRESSKDIARKMEKQKLHKKLTA